MVYYNNEWGTVCNNKFGEKDAIVACRSLGLAYVFSLVYIALFNWKTVLSQLLYAGRCV